MKWFSKQHKEHGLITAQSLSARLPEILLDAQKIAMTLRTGAHGRRKVGAGDHFWQYRAYDPSADSSARIDWRQSAKSHHLYVREQEDERAQTAYIWIDPSASMHFTSDAAYRTKYEYAFLLGCVLAYQLTQASERVGVLSENGEACIIDHPKQVERLAATMMALPDTLDFSVPAKSKLIIVSDFLSFNYNLLDSFIKSKIQNNVSFLVVSPYDVKEYNYDYAGHVKFENMQQSDTFEIQDAQLLKENYQRKFSQHLEALDAIFGRDQIVRFATDQSALETALKVTQRLIL